MEKTRDTSSVTANSYHSGDENKGNAATLPSRTNNITVPKENVVNDIESHEYLSGLKLVGVMFCITLGGFLLLLDTSILSTVS
jgi:hypothetical protein